jgi:hypothetical protein
VRKYKNKRLIRASARSKKFYPFLTLDNMAFALKLSTIVFPLKNARRMTDTETQGSTTDQEINVSKCAL